MNEQLSLLESEDSASIGTLPGADTARTTGLSVRGADFSPCGTYRYCLWRRIGSGDWVNFLMLNPSTADALTDDPTVRRCIGYARAWRCGGIWITNLYAYRATRPRDLAKAGASAVGPGNDAQIARIAALAGLVVCAWGNHAADVDPGRAGAVLRILEHVGTAPQILGLTAAGQPQHPLFLPKDRPCRTWQASERLALLSRLSNVNTPRRIRHG